MHIEIMQCSKDNVIESYNTAIGTNHYYNQIDATIKWLVQYVVNFSQRITKHAVFYNDDGKNSKAPSSK